MSAEDDTAVVNHKDAVGIGSACGALGVVLLFESCAAASLMYAGFDLWEAVGACIALSGLVGCMGYAVCFIHDVRSTKLEDYPQTYRQYAARQLSDGGWVLWNDYSKEALIEWASCITFPWITVSPWQHRWHEARCSTRWGLHKMGMRYIDHLERPRREAEEVVKANLWME